MVEIKKIFAGRKSKRESNEIDAIPTAGSSTTIGPLLDESPEAQVRRAIKGFCEHGAATAQHEEQSVGRNLSFHFTISYRREPKKSKPGSSHSLVANRQGEEVLYLPTIVDSAESSPTAAKEAAAIIKKYIDMKYAGSWQLQYNAIMLMRILADNPGPTFTRNLDYSFAVKVKELFKASRNANVRQILAETLDYFDVAKGEDENLVHLKAVWQKQKAILAKYQPPMRTPGGTQPIQPHPQLQGQTLQQYLNQLNQTPGSTSLPPLDELVGRISEAQMSAKLLHQVLGSTPRSEVLTDELVKEFVHRCRAAANSMADFITCDNPPPDTDTMSTLIETNDILRIALARYDAIKESVDMQNTPVPPAVTPPLVATDPAARNDGPPDLENPFTAVKEIPPLTYPGTGGTSATYTRHSVDDDDDDDLYERPAPQPRSAVLPVGRGRMMIDTTRVSVSSSGEQVSPVTPSDKSIREGMYRY